MPIVEGRSPTKYYVGFLLQKPVLLEIFKHCCHVNVCIVVDGVMTVWDTTSRHMRWNISTHSWVKAARGAHIPEECKCRGAAANDKSSADVFDYGCSSFTIYSLWVCLDEFNKLQTVRRRILMEYLLRLWSAVHCRSGSHKCFFD